MQQFLALSVVAPNGTRIAQRIKTLEVRSWVPAQLPLKDLFIVENQNFLKNDGDEDNVKLSSLSGFTINNVDFINGVVKLRIAI